eukprot:535607_1
MTTDQTKCVIRIYNLPKNDRIAGIKFYKFISRNIITQPTVKRFQLLPYDKIYNKFNKHDSFIKLLLLSGFKEYLKPKHLLRFNINDIHLLKQSIILLNKQEIEISSNKLNKEHKITSHDTHLHSNQHICICGHPLIKTTCSIYGKGNDHTILCDNCLIECKGSDTIYHCTLKTKCSEHIYGFDLCENCIST